MALYQLTLFYPTLKEHASLLRSIRTSVETIAGTHWRVLSAGEHTCAIGFATDLPRDTIRTRLGRLDGIERFEFLLVEVSAVVDGYLGKGTLDWLRAHRPA